MTYNVRVHDKFIDDLKKLKFEVRLSVAKLIEKLKEKEILLKMPLSKSLGDGLFELRIISNNNQVRILYFHKNNNNLYLLHVFVKKTQKTPIQNLEKAKKRLKELKNGK